MGLCCWVKYNIEEKATMLVQEILSSAYKYKVTHEGDSLYRASFDAGDRAIHVDLAKIPRTGEHWELAFEERKAGKPGSMGVTGSGDEFKVFATVIEITQEFMREYKIDSLSFTADKSEGNRSRLYQRMVDRLLPPGWKQDVDNSGDYRTYFTIAKPE